MKVTLSSAFEASGEASFVVMPFANRMRVIPRIAHRLRHESNIRANYTRMFSVRHILTDRRPEERNTSMDAGSAWRTNRSG
ncbi:hypothetical protein D3C84_1229170 [compost metagenome]